MQLRHIAATVCTLLLGLATAHGEDSRSGKEVKPFRPATTIYTLEAGGSHIADTYLSPLIYGGYSVALNYDRWQAFGFSPRNWTHHLGVDVRWLDTNAPTSAANMWYLGIDAHWAMQRRWSLPRHFTLAIGPDLGLSAGCVYNNRNGNNPASAKAALNLGVAAYAKYDMRLGRLPLSLSYQVSMPVVGLFFAPDYGELYYEIWLGNHRGLSHMSHPGNYFAMDNLLAADMRLGSVTLRLGYRGRVLSTNINHITTRLTSNAVVIGISGEWLTLDKARKVIDNDIETIKGF